jgi:prepilin-type N-terminal cleavage/methylation domain-containing protein
MRKGFTLIELLIVVAIIVILAAVIIPTVISKNDSTSANYSPTRGTTIVVPNRPDLKTCQFMGLDSLDRTVFKCPDGKFYTNP